MRNGPDRLRALNVPQRVVVELDVSGSPTRIGAVTVEVIRETWRIDDEWWRNSITRTYHEVLLAGGARVVIFLDHVKREWWMQEP